MIRIVVALGLAMLWGSAAAAPKKGTQFWNLTGVTLNDVRLAPAGTTAFGPNQCANDRDGEVDFDERLPVTGIGAGRYDLRLKDTSGRLCFARNVAVQEGAVFAVHERDLVDCRKE
jgi:hypothetical protein